MRLLHSAQDDHLVLMIGLGMIGRSIESALQDARYRTAAAVAVDWNDRRAIEQAIAEVKRYCASARQRRISVSWTAGDKGFGCRENEAALETDGLLAVLELVEDLRQSGACEAIDFHFMSSAGGLFEGQRVITPSSAPSPRRPYGNMKLSQERAIRERLADVAVSVYRPSTVYGPRRQVARHGLINNLINDGLRGCPTVLDAHVMSLRDYVYTADVGAFVAKHIRFPEPEPAFRTHFLVSSRCTSIFEVVHIIERVLHLKLRFRYDASFGNHSNITFSHSVLPARWAPIPLEVGIRQFVAGRHAHLPVPLGA